MRRHSIASPCKLARDYRAALRQNVDRSKEQAKRGLPAFISKINLDWKATRAVFASKTDPKLSPKMTTVSVK